MPYATTSLQPKLWATLYQDRRIFALWHAFLGNLALPFFYMVFWRSIDAWFQITSLGASTSKALIRFFAIPWDILVTGIAFFTASGCITAIICLFSFPTRRSLRLVAILPGSILYSFAGVFLLASHTWSQHLSTGLFRFLALFLVSFLTVAGLGLCIELLHTRILRGNSSKPLKKD